MGGRGMHFSLFGGGSEVARLSDFLQRIQI